MATWQFVLLAITVFLLGAVITLYILGKKAQKKKEAQDEQIAATAQTISMLIIDKKKMKLKDAGLPAAVLAQAPRVLRSSKLPIVKAKVGPKIMTFICEGEIFDKIPTKKEVKAVVSGLYITSVKGLRVSNEQAPQKKKFMDKFKKAKAE
ncbi:MAG: hypothetical protein HFH41_05300 [Lachnospiraceae bacterium]|nr:hypothetical protein [Lachnospiraceae bacterium]